MRARRGLTGCVLLLVLSWPSILLLQNGSIAGVLSGLILLGLALVCFESTMPSTLPALFPTGEGLRATDAIGQRAEEQPAERAHHERGREQERDDPDAVHPLALMNPR